MREREISEIVVCKLWIRRFLGFQPRNDMKAVTKIPKEATFGVFCIFGNIVNFSTNQTAFQPSGQWFAQY